MSRVPSEVSASAGGEDENWRAGGTIVAERWPTLARAMGTYQSGVAERFSRMAYECVEGGLIRFDRRQRLARAAERMGIRPFDAQLLIACAVRKWALDRAYDASPCADAPKLSFEYRSWGKMWMRWAVAAGMIVGLEGLIVWHWIGGGR
ncbi:MAG TPA: hypothetical protein VH253_07105 [Phycisphaerae bacterium]|nr:hypothetical protein [Phycisphaerae bacterium]